MTALDVLMPVAAGEREVVRAADALESLAAYEREVGTVVLVDDAARPGDAVAARVAAPQPRDLVAECVPAGLREHSIVVPNPRSGRDSGLHGGTCAATLAGLRVLHERGSAPLVLRLDSDALVIGPFTGTVAAALAAQADVGVVGSYTHAPTGLERDFGDWAHRVRKLSRPLWAYRHPPPDAARVRLAVGGRAGRVRGQLRAALRNGYGLGEHCLAAACVVNRELVRRLADAGDLDDPLTWLGTWCGDDVMLGVLTRAAGMTLLGMTGDGEPFGIAQRRLPGPPEWLVEQGYAIVHAVKAEAGIDEDAVRGFFRERRAALPQS